MKKYKKAIFGLLIIILALGIVTFGIWYSYKKSQRSNKALREKTDAQVLTEENNKHRAIVLTISNGKEEKTYEIENQASDITVFNLMKGLKENTDDFDFEFKEYDFGIMITSINGIVPDEKHFWKLIINNKDASKGVSETKVKNGDKITFKLDEIKY